MNIFCKINNLWFSISDKIRFLIIGTFNAGVSYLIFSLLCFIFGVFYYQIALVLSWIISSFSSFAMQRFFVFNINGNIIKQYLKCCTTWVGSYIINACVLEILVKFLKLNVYISQILATIFCAVFTYIFLKRFAFKK